MLTCVKLYHIIFEYDTIFVVGVTFNILGFGYFGDIF